MPFFFFFLHVREFYGLVEIPWYVFSILFRVFSCLMFGLFIVPEIGSGSMMTLSRKKQLLKMNECYLQYAVSVLSALNLFSSSVVWGYCDGSGSLDSAG